MYRTFPRGYVVFCDDVRHEEGNKPSYMGVYHNFMFITGPLPILLPKFVACVTYIDALATPHGDTTVQLFLPGDPEDKPSFTVPLKVNELADKAPPKSITGRPVTKLNFQFELQISPFVIKEGGFIRVLAVRSDGTLELGRLEITSAIADGVPEPTQATANPVLNT